MPLFKLMKSLVVPVWQNIRQRFISPIKPLSQTIYQPILSSTEITDFAEQLAQASSKVSPNLKQSEALRQGEQTSQFMGAGLEYEESRAYQPGDEIRRINWRLMARTGKAYTKLFQEERQENWFILVDHRASMRFGTRKRLKATQAARVAGYYAWLAQQIGIPVATGRLAEEFEQSRIFEGKSIYSHVMEFVSQPCPPSLKISQIEPSFNDVLVSLTAQLQPGSRLILISDFHDVNQETTEILTALQSRVAIKAVWVEDIAETQLPEIEGLQLQSMVNQQTYAIADAEQRLSYQAWSVQYQTHIQQAINQAAVGVYSLYAHEPLSEMMLSLSLENKNNLFHKRAQNEQVNYG
ncbi:DUF58 domain-containing protein [Thiomicrorhabdus sp. Kp2]|uniref:DUF58 domain-containing protein n=1 Tax=Thiomicrorhabdus sp. Kp2 TaxID=1123518 RepID=UPI0012FF3AF9|nr:DUF58 domain-containing protein [Thiomicrorhabdus sp. Kp2]